MRRLLFLNGMRAFEAAARSGSFAGAGSELNVSAAAVSRMVHLLEQRLGVALFERKANPLTGFVVRIDRFARNTKNAIEALPEAFRIAVLLADVEGFSYKEIADITEVPIGTVMSRIHRGRKALQKALHDFAVARGLVGSAEAGH